MRMIPADVVIAQAEYSVWPRKYKLSNTFTGSACHVSRGGGPGGRGAALARPRPAFDASRGVASVQMRLKTPANSVPAAALAAATWASADGFDCAAMSASAAAATAASVKA